MPETNPKMRAAARLALNDAIDSLLASGMPIGDVEASGRARSRHRARSPAQAAVIAAATTLRTSGVAGELGELLSELYELVDVRVELQIPDPFDVGELVETWHQKRASAGA